jgi:caa(3)-type oxidase subunit IV
MSNDHAHATDNRQYFTTWCWLLLMTLAALTIGYISMPEGIKALLLVSTTLAKIVLIGRIFMHLKFEKMNLVMLTFSPLLLSMILYFMTRGETRMHDQTHQVITHQGEVIPSEGAAEVEGAHAK